MQRDLIVYGGTEAGVICAVQAARLGLATALVSESSYLFGFFPSLGAWETHYSGFRAPLSEEVRQRIVSYYRETYGERSEELSTCLDRDANNPMITFEPHVAELVLRRLIEREENLEVHAPMRLLKVVREGNQIESVFFQKKDHRPIAFSADTFIDCSYMGDLAALAGAQYRLGRESREEFSEPHAGRIFTTWKEGRYPQDAVEGKLRLSATWTTGEVLPESTGAGDRRIQDYSYRCCLSSDPDNRILPAMPHGYDRSRYLAVVESPDVKKTKRYPLQHRWLTHTLEEMVERDHLFHGHKLPRNKRNWNATNFTGAANDYPESGPQARRAIEKAHRNHALGLLYFLQNDHAIPEGYRRIARRWGLARDEFRTHGNRPPVIYAREGRRFEGSYFYREQDCLLRPGLARAPIHHDGIAITEFPLDSLPCSTDRVEDSLPDGQFFEKDLTRPGSLPYRCLIPSGTFNLLVPTAPSVTHCAWGTVRQSSCLLHLAEVSARAALLAHKRGETVAQLPAERLQVYLVRNRLMPSFFNDFDMSGSEPWIPAISFLATRGFFWNYDADPDAALTTSTAVAWVEAFRSWTDGPTPDPNEIAQAVRQAEEKGDRTKLSHDEFDRRLHGATVPGRTAAAPSQGPHINRGTAAVKLFKRYLAQLQKRAPV